MSGVDEFLVRKGADIPRLGVLDQARVQRELLAKYIVLFMEYGWTDEHTRQFDDAIALVSSERAAAIEARTASKNNLERQERAVTEAKALKRKLVLAFNDLQAARQLGDHVHQAITKSGRLRRSPTLLSGYFTDIRPHVATYSTPLRRYFRGAYPLELLDPIVAELDSAQAKQEADYSALPLETRKVYEAKGLLLSLIEQINRIGKIAFDGDAMAMAQFNKDLLQRARKARRATSTIEPACGEAEMAKEETG